MRKREETVTRTAADNLVHNWAQYGIPISVIHAMRSEQPIDALQVLRERENELIGAMVKRQPTAQEMHEASALKETMQKMRGADVPDTLTTHIRSLIIDCMALTSDMAASNELIELESLKEPTAESLIDWCGRVTARNNRLLHRVLVQTIRDKLYPSKENLSKLLKAKEVRTLLTDQDHKDIFAMHNVSTLYAIGTDPEAMEAIDDADIGTETYALIINKFLKANCRLPSAMKERIRKGETASAEMLYHALLIGLYENNTTWIRSTWGKAMENPQWNKSHISGLIGILIESRYGGRIAMLQELCHMYSAIMPWTKFFVAIAKIRLIYPDEEEKLEYALGAAMYVFPLAEKKDAERWTSALRAAIRVADERVVRLLLDNMNAEIAHEILIDQWPIITARNAVNQRGQNRMSNILLYAREMVLREQKQEQKQEQEQGEVGAKIEEPPKIASVVP